MNRKETTPAFGLYSRNSVLTFFLVILVAGLLYAANQVFDAYMLRILNLCGIYIVLSLSLVLINGFVGLFSLGHAGFMAVGAYVFTLLSLSPTMKAQVFYLEPIVPWLANVELPYLPALFLAGLAAAFAGLLIGAPVLRLKDDYLAIATLGFAEIIRIIITNIQSVTNGPLGITGVTPMKIWIFDMGACIWICAIVTVLFMVRLVRGSYGKAFMAIREDEVAAEAMGINVFKHKLLAFVIASFFAGVGGALLGNIMLTIDPTMFRFTLTYNIVLIVVLGGIGSLTGGVLAAIVVTVGMEALRFLDGDFIMGNYTIHGIPGMRMVVFSLLMMFIIIFKPSGIMGRKEFSWAWVMGLPSDIKALPGKVKAFPDKFKAKREKGKKKGSER